MEIGSGKGEAFFYGVFLYFNGIKERKEGKGSTASEGTCTKWVTDHETGGFKRIGGRFAMLCRYPSYQLLLQERLFWLAIFKYHFKL